MKDPRVDPSVEDNYAIKWAAKRGNFVMVRLLLTDPRVDPSAEDNYALKHALQNAYTEISQPQNPFS